MTEPHKINPLLILTWLVVALLSILLLKLSNEFTHDRIVDNRQQSTLRVLLQIIPGQYNNEIFKDAIQIIEPDYFGTDQPVTVYRSRNETSILGVVLYPVVAEGYKGPIKLGVGVTRDGTISGVRVLYEEETEGLGAEIHQQKSDWIQSFAGVSYDTVPREQWDVSSENGYFDQISGATITSRSVINAVRNTLDYHELAGENLYTD